MGYGVLGGAVLQCSFGMAPSVLNVLPTARVLSSMPMAAITDCVPLVNIMPFGMCSSIANPTVAAATTAAMGALTPMPCIPVIAGTWMPGSATVLVGGKPALNQNCKLTCAYGGVIEIKSPGTFNIQVK